ncbi:hypothetical protein AUP68_16912 [Ilyonectria robusta]
MDEMYEKRVPARKMRKYVTDVQRAVHIDDHPTSKSPSINVQMEMQMIVVAIPPSSDTM